MVLNIKQVSTPIKCIAGPQEDRIVKRAANPILETKMFTIQQSVSDTTFRPSSTKMRIA
ncbi:1538_t:CDS:2 [Paraglomus brasilianum]|uniref:1538_t:CDS:1 n=1 Tax=Paraglomus brasilianum TaxID=144538 RepID=A0A9N8WN29_9GLOM|nr:1538_t:CDS:2 [Paraglomus brasilianum]